MTEHKIECAYDKLVPVKSLRPNPRNRNKHPKEQVERLAKILKYQGWRNPIKVSNRSGYITAGHGRLEAALLNGWTEVPVDYQDYETEEQEYADLTADNAIASWAELDLSGINLDIGDLGPDFEIDLLGIEGFTVDVAELPELSDEPRNPIRQMVFEVTEEQNAQINRALEHAKSLGEFEETGNSNSNGNALTRIAEIFITQNGTS